MTHTDLETNMKLNWTFWVVLTVIAAIYSVYVFRSCKKSIKDLPVSEIRDREGIYRNISKAWR